MLANSLRSAAATAENLGKRLDGTEVRAISNRSNGSRVTQGGLTSPFSGDPLS